jgi:uncharacterized protein (TIGR00369 family)
MVALAMMTDISLQDRFAPRTRCFGCGPANPNGLRIKSYARDDEVVATFRAEPHHEAFAGAVSGGIVGTLLDCHCNWTAAYTLMNTRSQSAPPCTVTAEYTVRFLAPTPSDQELTLRARTVQSSDRKAVVEGHIEADGTITATCRGVFVAVEEGHPAFHRW